MAGIKKSRKSSLGNVRNIILNSLSPKVLMTKYTERIDRRDWIKKLQYSSGLKKELQKLGHKKSEVLPFQIKIYMKKIISLIDKSSF